MISRDPRSTTNAVFNDNQLKLGTFCTNVSSAASMSMIDGRFEATWPNTLRLAQIADDAGFEALVPVARWRGFGGTTNVNGSTFETYTWAAGLGVPTKSATVFSTSHVPTIHPIVAAKQATTIDHISGGRFALNIVCGWYAPELRMFGAPLMAHDTAYEYASEWVEIVKMLWTREEEFDYEGKFFKIEKGFHQPKPIQKPYPLLMNAGISPVGREFVLKYCDVAFTSFRDATPDETKKQIAAYRARARSEYGRELSIWSGAVFILGDTEADAKALFDECIEKGDWDAVDNMMSLHGTRAASQSPEQIIELKRRHVVGWGTQAFGTAEMIADRLEQLSNMGYDGILVTTPQYETGLRRFVKDVIPLLVQKGLRKAAPPGV